MENAKEAVPGWLAAALGKQDPQMLKLVENFPTVIPSEETHLYPLATSYALLGMVTLQTSSSFRAPPKMEAKFILFSRSDGSTDSLILPLTLHRGMDSCAVSFSVSCRQQWLQHRLHFKNGKVGHHAAAREKNIQ